MLGWIKERLGLTQTCECEAPTTDDQVHCDVCGYEIVERAKDVITRMHGPV